MAKTLPFITEPPQDLGDAGYCQDFYIQKISPAGEGSDNHDIELCSKPDGSHGFMCTYEVERLPVGIYAGQRVTIYYYRETGPNGFVEGFGKEIAIMSHQSDIGLLAEPKPEPFWWWDSRPNQGSPKQDTATPSSEKDTEPIVRPPMHEAAGLTEHEFGVMRRKLREASYDICECEPVPPPSSKEVLDVILRFAENLPW